MSNTCKLPVNELKVGMYISNLDRSWLETPFLLQGFNLETEQDIVTVCEYCDHVYVDLSLSKHLENNSYKSTPRPLDQGGSNKSSLNKSTSNPNISDPTASPRKSIKEIFAGKNLIPYADKFSWRNEFPKAQAAISSISECVKGILSGSDKNFTLDMVKVKRAVEPMIESVTRNPDACIWLARMKEKDDYTYHHSIGCSIWSVALGRQLGLQKAELRSLAIGGLLFDVGKLKLNKAILTSKKRLTDLEFQKIKQHVQIGTELLKDSGIINQDILNIVAFHHERHNGKGYPNGLAGDDIPVFARIAAIVDCYDAITSHRYYAKALPPAEAIKNLYEWKGIDFQAELVEEFIQAVGIYPAGTLVELSSGEVAIVVAEYRSRRLRPQVMVLLDRNKAPLSEMKFIDLSNESNSINGKLLEIVSSLEPEAYGINMMAIEL